MAKLIDAVETELGTDFAILTAGQEDVDRDYEVSFAGSSPGFIRLETGNKYSNIRIRAERWDGRPPLTDEWEDVDDIPFEEVPTGGKLTLSGFDPGEIGLDVSGFGRGRAQAYARGRHRYEYNSYAEGMDPEEWLLRLYPLAGQIDPMAGGPRRIAGGGGLSRPSVSPWGAALLGLQASGWSNALLGSNGYTLATRALWSVAAPLTRMQLATKMVRWMPPWELGGPDSEAVIVAPDAHRRDELNPLAMHSGRDHVDTIGDAIDALVSIGLLVGEERNGEQLLLPNPAPEPAWERIGMTGWPLVRARFLAMDEHRNIAATIRCAVAWCGENGLTSTPRAMAIRWCTSVADVLGGLRLLGGSARVKSDRELGFDSEIDPDDPLTLWMRSTTTFG